MGSNLVKIVKFCLTSCRVLARKSVLVVFMTLIDVVNCVLSKTKL